MIDSRCVGPPSDLGNGSRPLGNGNQSTIKSRAANTVASAVSVTVRCTGPWVFSVTMNVALP